MGCVGAAAGASIGADAAIAQNALDLEAIERAVKANFGSGFELRHAHRASGDIVAVIEHLENKMQVSTPDLNNWKLLRASQM